jgi:monooxygenase
MTEHADVVIIGAGLAGISAAHHLQASLPGKSYIVLETRDAIGGTWDLFRYPGVRSDSDMYTFGYRFRPWASDQAIADGPSILGYIREVAAADGIDSHVRFGHRVTRASWSAADARWTVHVARGGQETSVSCGFLMVCGGYYRYDQGYQPQFAGLSQFRGQVVHPQHWPAGLDYAGKRVVVIGSGATAVTLVPALARAAAHVTMLQRSPTYVIALPSRDPVAGRLRRRLGRRAAYAIARWKNVLLTAWSYRLSRRRPEVVRRALRQAAISHLPDGYDVDTHFSPAYNPWDQRLCVAADGDLFAAIREGKADVITDRIAAFTEHGVALESGAEVPADIVITATGLQLLPLGGVGLDIDGEPVALADTMVYKGVMLGGVPNLGFTMGYTNASWTLKADLASGFVCRLLRHMSSRGYDVCVPVNDDPRVSTQPLLDFTSGYVRRSVDQFPKAGSHGPWRFVMSYPHDIRVLRYGRLHDGVLRFARRPATPAGATPAGATAQGAAVAWRP